MYIEDVLIAIGIGVIATLIASGVIWIFRRQVSQALTALDMSAGAIFGWVMAYIILGVIIVFALQGIEVPIVLTSMFGLLIVVLITTTVWRRR